MKAKPKSNLKPKEPLPDKLAWFIKKLESDKLFKMVDGKINLGTHNNKHVAECEINIGKLFDGDFKINMAQFEILKFDEDSDYINNIKLIHKKIMSTVLLFYHSEYSLMFEQSFARIVYKY